MRIQEIRAGILHLTKKKVEGAGGQNQFEWRDLNSVSLTDDSAEMALPADCELDEPMWSVVSFDKTEAGGLKYWQAAELLRELEAHGLTGLCIVTDDAAIRTR